MLSTQRWNTGKTQGDANCYPDAYTRVNPIAKEEMICDFVFGRGICCGGFNTDYDTPSDVCAFYNCESHNWTLMHDFPEPLIYEAAVVIKEKNGDDIGWLVSGGSGKRKYL